MNIILLFYILEKLNKLFYLVKIIFQKKKISDIWKNLKINLALYIYIKINQYFVARFYPTQEKNYKQICLKIK